MELPEWLLASAKDEKRDIHENPDGTFTVWVRYCDHAPIHGIPTRQMAEEIVAAMWEMEREAAREALMD